MTCGGHLLQVLEDSKGMKKERWVRDNPGQMVITAGQIAWTAECEAALADAGSARKKLSTLKKKWISYLDKLTVITQSQLTAIERNKVLLYPSKCEQRRPLHAGRSTACHGIASWIVSESSDFE